MNKEHLDKLIEGIDALNKWGEIDLRGADLAKADLSGAYLIRANLIGAKLDGANLTGTYT